MAYYFTSYKLNHFMQLKNNKIIISRVMKSSTSPLHEMLAKESISKALKRKENQLYNLNHNFDKKYSLRTNLIKNRNLRQERFILSQRKILQRQHISLHKAKQIIDLKQKKAQSNKSYSMVQKSKKVQAELSKWSKIVQKNKDQYQTRIKETIKLMNEGNDQLSHSSSKKSIYLNELFQNCKDKYLHRSKQYHTSREMVDSLIVNNPESNRQHLQIKDRYISLTVHRHSSKKSLRLSTESASDKKRKFEQSQLQKSLISIANKQEKINQARYIKLYIQERKKKQKQEKTKVYQQIRSNHLSQMKIDVQERSNILDQKFKNSRIKARNKKSSLPQINGTGKSQLALMHDPGEERRKKCDANQNTEQHIKYQSAYDKLVMERVKDVQNFIRKNKRL